MKPVDAKLNTYIDSSKEINNKDPKFKIGSIVRISKNKNISVKDYTPNWSEEVFMIKKVKNTVTWNYFMNDLNGEKIVRIFYEKELQKSPNKFRIEKVIKRKSVSADVDTSTFAKKTDLANLGSDVDKLDIDKLKNIPSGISNLKSKVDKLDVVKLETNPVDLIELSNVVKDDVDR